MPSSRRRPPVLLPAAGLAVVLVGGGVFQLVAARDDGGSAEPAPASREIVPDGVEDGPADPPPVDGAADLEAYRVVYRVDAFGPEGSITDTEVHEVRRPFDARVENLVGEPPGGATSALGIWSFGVVEVGAVEQERATLVGEPTVPNGEVGTGASLDDAIDAGVLVYLVEQQEIAGRECHRYRTGGPLESVLLTEPTDSDFADLCIDGDGLVLGESWVVNGKLFRRRTAVEVDTSPDLADDRFEPLGTPPEFGAGGGLIGEVTADSQFPDVAHWELPEPPDGFERRGRYSFTPAVAGDTAAVTGEQPPVLTGLSDVYEAGPDAVIVVNGGTNDGSNPLAGVEEGKEVDLGDLGRGWVRHRVRGAEVLVPLEGGRFVKVHGTLSAGDLVAVARSLVPRDGTGRTITAAPDGEALPGPA